MKNYWLFSTEPDSYPWQKVEAEKKVRWDGIRGWSAQRHMRHIKRGDTIFAYHSSPEKSVVGLAEAVSTSYSDPTVPEEEKNKWHVIDVKWKSWFAKPVPIAVMRKTRALKKMPFLVMPRLSISPVSPSETKALLALGR